MFGQSAVGHVARQEFLTRLHANMFTEDRLSWKTMEDISAKMHMNVREFTRTNRMPVVHIYYIVATISFVCRFANEPQQITEIIGNIEKDQNCKRIDIQKIVHCLVLFSNDDKKLKFIWFCSKIKLLFVYLRLKN